MIISFHRARDPYLGLKLTIYNLRVLMSYAPSETMPLAAEGMDGYPSIDQSSPAAPCRYVTWCPALQGPPSRLVLQGLPSHLVLQGLQ